MKQKLQCVALAAASLIITLCVAELGLRLAAPSELIPVVERDPLLGWHGRPGLRCIYSVPASRLAFPVSHNAGGFRDVPHDRQLRPGRLRVLCIGDSFTWGWGVAEDEIYTAVLADILGERGLDAEVINAGVPGYNTVQSLLYLESSGLEWSPDVVVCQACDNDLSGNLEPTAGSAWRFPHAELRGDGSLEIVGAPFPGLRPLEWLKYHCARHSRLATLLRVRLECRRQTRAREAAMAAGPTPAEDGVTDPFRIFVGLLRRMADDCERRRARLVVLLDFEFSDEQREHLASSCGDVEVLSVLKELEERERETGDAAIIAGDGHWTARGHEWVAACLADRILQVEGTTAERP